MRSRRATLAVLGTAGALLIVVALAWGTFAQPPAGLVYVIPAGARSSIARPGVDSAIAIPTDIRFAAGDPAVITIRNLDDVTHRAGSFLVGPGQTYVQRFPEPGRYPIACAVNPLQSIVVTVGA